MNGMSDRAMAVRAKMNVRGKRKRALGTVRSAATDPKNAAMGKYVGKKDAVQPFIAGPLGLGVLSVPPKPVKR